MAHKSVEDDRQVVIVADDSMESLLENLLTADSTFALHSGTVKDLVKFEAALTLHAIEIGKALGKDPSKVTAMELINWQNAHQM